MTEVYRGEGQRLLWHAFGEGEGSLPKGGPIHPSLQPSKERAHERHGGNVNCVGRKLNKKKVETAGPHFKRSDCSGKPPSFETHRHIPRSVFFAKDVVVLYIVQLLSIHQVVQQMTAPPWLPAFFFLHPANSCLVLGHSSLLACFGSDSPKQFTSQSLHGFERFIQSILLINICKQLLLHPQNITLVWHIEVCQSSELAA